MKRICAGLLGAFAATAFAQDVPVPKMLQDLKGQKGQYQVEILEGGGRAGRGTKITVCSDNLIKDAGGARSRPESDCRHKLLKDTDDEAVIESVCKERTNTVTLKRDGKSVLMQPSLQETLAAFSGSRPRGPSLADLPTPGPGESWPARALELLEGAQRRLRDGDWSGFGTALEELKELLQQANRPASDGF